MPAVGMLQRMKIHHAPALAIAASVAACAYPELGDLRARAPNASFVVEAPIGCLYERGVEHVSAYGTSEPKFQWHMEADRRGAWFRQPLTLVELRFVSEGRTEVRRMQTAGSEAVGQAERFIGFLRGNPCRTTNRTLDP